MAQVDYKVIEQRFLIPSLRVLALSYSVPTTKLYDIIIPYDLKTDIYDRKSETRNSFKRLSEIIERLAINTGNDDEEKTKGQKGRDVQEKLFVRTIFSEELPDLMISEYNAFAKVVEAPEMMSEYRKFLKVRKNWSSCEGKKETAFAFSEALVLASLYLSHYRRAVHKLNKPITTENQKTRACGRFQRIKKHMLSKELHDGFARYIVEYSREWCAKEYKSIKYDHTREYRLPKRFYFTKDIRYAASRYYVKDDNSIDTSKWEKPRKERFYEQKKKLEEVRYYSDCICPLMKKILTGEIPDDISCEESVSNEGKLETYIGDLQNVEIADYLIACKAAKIVNTYMGYVYDGAKHLLSCLKEANDLDKRPFLDYFNEI